MVRSLAPVPAGHAGPEAFPLVPADAATSRKALVYLAHTSEGLSMRALSRQLGVHPSTVHRQVRRIEERRDDPLFDEAITMLDHAIKSGRSPAALLKETPPVMPKAQPVDETETVVMREAKRILRRMSESRAFLAVAPEAELAIVFRETVPGRPRQTASLPREIAKEFAIRDWIACRRNGKVACYEITAAGRAALERMLARETLDRREAQGMAEARSPFQMQHQEEVPRQVMAEDGSGPAEIQVNATESPLAWLARRAGAGGTAFLRPREFEAGERLREDFERGEMGPRVTQNWERFLTAARTGPSGAGRGPAEGPTEARARVAGALKALGPGLSDIALRCCCFLEGLETAEKRLGWSKRSGKVVLRIALQRLADHYGLSEERLA